MQERGTCTAPRCHEGGARVTCATGRDGPIAQATECSRLASRNATGMLRHALPGKGLALHTGRKAGGSCPAAWAASGVLHRQCQEARCIQEVHGHVTPCVYRKRLIPCTQEERLVSPVAWDPACARRESSCHAAWAEKGGLTLLVPGEGSLACAGMGALALLGQEQDFAPRVSGRWMEG